MIVMIFFVLIMERLHSTSTESWRFLGSKLPKSEIVYFCQMTVVYTIIITSVVNLSLTNGSSELWIYLLSSAIGYVLPDLSLKANKI